MTSADVVRQAALALLLGACSTAASAGAEGLLHACQGSLRALDHNGKADAVESGYCVGMVQGVFEMANYYGDRQLRPALRVCAPDQVTNEQLVRIVVKWLENHPKVLSQAPGTAALGGLIDAFPCTD